LDAVPADLRPRVVLVSQSPRGTRCLQPERNSLTSIFCIPASRKCNHGRYIIALTVTKPGAPYQGIDGLLPDLLATTKLQVEWAVDLQSRYSPASPSREQSLLCRRLRRDLPKSPRWSQYGVARRVTAGALSGKPKARASWQHPCLGVRNFRLPLVPNFWQCGGKPQRRHASNLT
jgi:hypothetical protein